MVIVAPVAVLLVMAVAAASGRRVVDLLVAVEEGWFRRGKYRAGVASLRLPIEERAREIREG